MILKCKHSNSAIKCGTRCGINAPPSRLIRHIYILRTKLSTTFSHNCDSISSILNFYFSVQEPFSCFQHKLWTSQIPTRKNHRVSGRTILVVNSHCCFAAELAYGAILREPQSRCPIEGKKFQYHPIITFPAYIHRVTTLTF